jgi:hypothetical protein
MACPTCSHTIQGCGYGIFHCPRCGTMKIHDAVYVPALVARAKAFFAESENGRGLSPASLHLWNTLGIPESITPESQRRTNS